MIVNFRISQGKEDPERFSWNRIQVTHRKQRWTVCSSRCWKAAGRFLQMLAGVILAENSFTDQSNHQVWKWKLIFHIYKVLKNPPQQKYEHLGSMKHRGSWEEHPDIRESCSRTTVAQAGQESNQVQTKAGGWRPQKETKRNFSLSDIIINPNYHSKFCST